MDLFLFILLNIQNAFFQLMFSNVVSLPFQVSSRTFINIRRKLELLNLSFMALTLTLDYFFWGDFFNLILLAWDNYQNEALITKA